MSTESSFVRAIDPARRTESQGPARGRTLVSLYGVSKRYRTAEIETVALDGIDLEIAAGAFVAIMGPSGCGKSTLLNIVGLVDSPSSGVHYFGQHEVSRYSESRLAALRKGHIGFIFQRFNLIAELDVRSNVELPLVYQGVPKTRRRELVLDALDRVGLAARAKHMPDQLSGGQQQRVAFARAVVGKPTLILADEPTGNLDTKSGEAIMRMLAALTEQGTTVVMVTHSASHAARAHQVLNLLDGRIATAHRPADRAHAGAHAGALRG
ncbi:MAG TPA: ABC transporter ATP-binding protein [Gammaproteobacteria bacterium]|nr:ABC transporter ATP-binding protein [Gammaproteobacteria bacterium]